MDAKTYLQSLNWRSFKELANDFQEICETGKMDENSLFGKFSETYVGKEPDKYIRSQLIFGQEAVRRLLKVI